MKSAFSRAGNRHRNVMEVGARPLVPRIVADKVLRAQILADVLKRRVKSVLVHVKILAAGLLCQGDQRMFAAGVASSAGRNRHIDQAVDHHFISQRLFQCLRVSVFANRVVSIRDKHQNFAALFIARVILRPQDQMSVMQFATNVSVLTPFTNKVSVIDRGLNRLHTDWATALYNAIVQGSDLLGGKEGRKVLIVVSDGDDTVGEDSYPQALEHALRNEVMIYSLIDVPIVASAGRDTGGEHALISLSEQTGGKYFYVNQLGLDAAFERVSEDLRTQYLIGYYPRNQLPGTDFHRITVTVPRAAEGDFSIRYRTGYYSDAPEAGN